MEAIALPLDHVESLHVKADLLRQNAQVAPLNIRPKPPEAKLSRIKLAIENCDVESPREE